ncbi:hypothetical protein [Miltoncostaea oceani]|uniref:hypothetical protein n=1 Tax=Miltoncostaea oceani TaxID=2843216 RepID=UPI001C3DA1A3|nr:hypothetical protein [Miltoncostaea oceani]
MTKRLRIAVGAALCVLALSTAAVYAAVGGDGQAPPPAIASEPVFPSAAQVEPSETDLVRQVGDVRLYVTEGANERAGWVCLIRVAPVATSTSCNPPEEAAKRGMVSSAQDPRTGEIELWAWLPDGFTTATSAGVSDSAVGNVVVLTLPKSAEVLRASGPAGELELEVPKAVG